MLFAAPFLLSAALAAEPSIVGTWKVTLTDRAVMMPNCAVGNPTPGTTTATWTVNADHSPTPNLWVGVQDPKQFEPTPISGRMLGTNVTLSGLSEAVSFGVSSLSFTGVWYDLNFVNGELVGVRHLVVMLPQDPKAVPVTLVPCLFESAVRATR